MALLLGIPDRQVTEDETTSWEVNKIGGTPDWFQENTELPCCRKCQREMILVTQVYCPLTNSPFHRCLHIFVCPSKPCSMQTYGWRVIRTQLLAETPVQQSKVASADNEWVMDQDDWGVGQDDWGDDDGDDGGSQSPDRNQDPLSTIQETTTDRLSKMTITNDPHPLHKAISDSAPTKLTDDCSSNPMLDTHCPASCGDGSTVTEKASADITGSEADVHDEGSSEPVEAEAMPVDDEGLQRMMGLLVTAGEDSGKDQEGENKGTGKGSEEAFPAYYLDVFAESDVEDAMSNDVARLLDEYQQREGQHWSAVLKDSRTGQSVAGAGEEKYDKTQVKHGDKQCYKFIKRLQACPQQCVRYQWNGSPLLISKSSRSLAVDKCERCQASRVFELQLIPPLIHLLTFPGQKDPQVEFGTVVVFTCSNSCWSEKEGYREEVVMVQQDPDQHLFR